MSEYERDTEQGESSADPAESGALEDEQQGKGYGEDEGERDESLESG